MRKNFLKASLLLPLCLLLTGCGCEHEWVNASCTAPQTCSVCRTTEGTLADHSWNAATCTTPKMCAFCGETEGEALGHKWEDAACTRPMVCSFCAEIAGNALGHDWKNATCTSPSTCQTCGTTTGEALGHTVTSWKVVTKSTCTQEGTENGSCTLCGDTIERTLELKEHTLADWVVTVEPTEGAKGTRVKLCKDCGKEVESEQFTLPPEEIEARYKSKCNKISYDNLARTPEKYEGEFVKFSGYVVQICSEASSPLYYSTYRVATSGKYNNVVLIYVDNYGSGERILEDDYITFYGKYDGLYTYTTVMGAQMTIPSIKVEYVD